MCGQVGPSPSLSQCHDVCSCQGLDVRPKGLYKVPFLALSTERGVAMWPNFFLAKQLSLVYDVSTIKSEFH